MPSIVSTGLMMRAPAEVSAAVDAMLLFGFFYLNEEICEFVWQGPRRYLVGSGWMNLLDWAGILAVMMAYFQMGQLFGLEPVWTEANTSAHWAEVAGQRKFQETLGFALFLVTFKGDPP